MLVVSVVVVDVAKVVVVRVIATVVLWEVDKTTVVTIIVAPIIRATTTILLSKSLNKIIIKNKVTNFLRFFESNI